MKQKITQFEFNDYGVCTNPNVIFHTCSKDKNKPYKGACFRIKTCQLNGYWYYGCGGDSNKGDFFGFGTPCSANRSDKKFLTEQAAIQAATEDIERTMKRNHAELPNDFWTALRNVVKKQPVQLELFEW